MTKIKETRSEAINDPAVSVFVERGVAKVSLNSTSLSGNTTDNNLSYKFDGWVLDNTTKSSYIVRNMGTDAGTYLKYSSEKFAPTLNSRFVGDTKLGNTSKQPDVDLYRTYWCVDPTYSQEFTATSHAANFNTVTSAADVASWLASGKYVYCHENTFDVAHMNYSNTTRALVKVTFNNGNKFYTNNGANAILDTDGKRDDAVMSYVLGTDINIVDLKKYLSDNQASTGTVTWSKADFKLTWAPTPDKDGILKVTKIELSAAGQAKLKTPSPAFTGWDAIKDQLNTNRVIRQYDNGASYYEVRIKHFAGDDAKMVILHHGIHGRQLSHLHLKLIQVIRSRTIWAVMDWFVTTGMTLMLLLSRRSVLLLFQISLQIILQMITSMLISLQRLMFSLGLSVHRVLSSESNLIKDKYRK